MRLSDGDLKFVRLSDIGAWDSAYSVVFRDTGEVIGEVRKMFYADGPSLFEWYSYNADGYLIETGRPTRKAAGRDCWRAWRS